MPPGVPVARVTGVGARTTDTATQPANVLAMIAAARNVGCLNCIINGSPSPALWQALRIELILDLRTVTFELATHPKVLLVIPDAAGEIGRDKRIARGMNLAVADHDIFI
jgi:hypothetical protein